MVPCEHCFGYYSRRLLANHVKGCIVKKYGIGWGNEEQRAAVAKTAEIVGQTQDVMAAEVIGNGKWLQINFKFVIPCYFIVSMCFNCQLITVQIREGT